MAQSLSGLESYEPSGSTPQPAPLSGLQLPSLFGGMGADGGLSGAAGPGAAGGQQGGPGLDFFQLLGGMLGGQDNGGSAVPPNLTGLFDSIGRGGLGSGNLGQMEGNGAFSGFGQSGGMSQPTTDTGGTGTAGSTGGQLNSIELIRQALGLGKSVLGQSGIAGSTAGPGGTGGLDINNFPGTSVSGADTGGEYGGAGLFQSGDLTTPFLNDPTIAGLIQGGGLFGGQQVPSELWDTFKSDPAFLEALRSGNALDNTNLLSDYPLGGTGGLDNPLSGIESGGGGGFGFGNLFGGLGGSLGLGAAGLGLSQAAASKNPIGILQNLYGLYSGVNSLGGFGGPTFGSLVSSLFGGGAAPAGAGAAGAAGAGESAGLGAGALAGGAGAGLSGFGAIVSAPFVLASISDMFDKSAQTFGNQFKKVTSAVPGEIASESGVPGLYSQIKPGTSVSDLENIYNQLGNIQSGLQGSGVENLLKSAGTLTGENTKFGLLGGGKNYSATYPYANQAAQAILPNQMLTNLGRLRIQDLIEQQTGQRWNGGLDPMSMADIFGGRRGGTYDNSAFYNALHPEESGYTPSGEFHQQTPEQQATSQNLMAQLHNLPIGGNEQALGQLMQPYGGWGEYYPLAGGIGVPWAPFFQ